MQEEIEAAAAPLILTTTISKASLLFGTSERRYPTLSSHAPRPTFAIDVVAIVLRRMCPASVHIIGGILLEVSSKFYLLQYYIIYFSDVLLCMTFLMTLSSSI